MFCKIGQGRLGPVLKASTQRRALPAAARLRGSATVPNSSGVSRASLLHPPPRAPVSLPAARGPPLCAPMPLGCQGPTGAVVPDRRALAPRNRAGSPGADGEEPRGRPVPGALRPGRPLPGEARGPPARSGEPQPMPSETRPAGAASARHSTVSALRPRASGAGRPASCEREAGSGAPARPLAMPRRAGPCGAETAPGWTQRGQRRQEDRLPGPGSGGGAAGARTQPNFFNGKRT